jgi:SMC interacting uncharacterized protein involved in chromosome segregation
MEREKLEEAKKTFDEDKDKFQKYMDDLNRKAEETAQDVQRLTSEKNEMMDRIQQLQLKIQKKKSKIKQIDEKLVVFKQHKHFLDTLAVSAGKKSRKSKRTSNSLKKGEGKEIGVGSLEHGGSRAQHRLSKKEQPGLFLTQLNQQLKKQ